MTLLREIQKKTKLVYNLLFMDDLKLFTKSEAYLESLVQFGWIFSSGIKAAFELSKCDTMVMT